MRGFARVTTKKEIPRAQLPKQLLVNQLYLTKDFTTNSKTPFTSEPYKFGGIIGVRGRFFMAGYISRFIVGVLLFKKKL